MINYRSENNRSDATHFIPISQRIGLPRPGRNFAWGIRITIFVVGAVVLLTLSAKIKVPFYPVPMTLQTLAIAIIAAALGARTAGLAVLSYLVIGLAGFPVFANTPPSIPGLAYLVGPTGGYLVGFLAAATLIGYLFECGAVRSFGGMWLAMMGGDLLILGLGVSWLAWGGVLSNSHAIGIVRALEVGFYPFVLGALLKELLAAAIVYGATRRPRDLWKRLDLM